MPRTPQLLPLLLLPLGCASPSQPKPPSLHLPRPVTNLAAQRLDSAVLLTWTTPTETTDGEAIRTPITAQICRDTATSAACTPVASLPVTPGASHASDPLPATLLTDPPRLLTYRIQLLNSKSRTAGPSAPALAASGIAPPPTGPLTLTPTPQGLQITWPKTRSTAAVELLRTQPPTATNKAVSAVPGRKIPNTAHLRGPEAPDSGGLTDPSAKTLIAYTYTAQRVRTLALQGHTLELRSLPSPPATFTLHDSFPPTIPTGLTAVVSGGFSSASTISIDLSWEPNPEPDLQGYNLYRSEAGAPFQRLNQDLIPGPAFRDLTAQPNHLYRYRVTAVDRTNNESQPTPTLTQQLN